MKRLMIAPETKVRRGRRPRIDPELIDRVTQSADREAAHGDDTLTVYLKQMGSIPLLNRKQELALAQRLVEVRRRYRRAALWNAGVLANVAATFARVQNGEQMLERVVDLVPSVGVTAERIAKRLPGHLRKLHTLLDEATAEFRQVLRSPSASTQARLRRERGRRLREMVRLAEELSPRTELLDQWSEELKDASIRLTALTRSLEAGQRSDHEMYETMRAERRELLLRVQAMPEELAELVHVLERRRRRYQEARSQLAEANLRLVVSVAKKYRGRGLSFDDLIQEGNSGLMRAVDKYDHGLGFKFGTYATWWIRQGITRALSDSSRTVRLPCHQASMLGAFERVRGELTTRLGHEPTLVEIAKNLGISPEDAYRLRVAGRPPVSLDEPQDEGEQRGLQELLTRDEDVNPAEEADQQLLRERVQEVLRSLTPRDRQILEMRYGLHDGRARTLDEIARHFGITRERIRQIETRGLKKLREPGRRDRLADFAERN